MTDITDHVIVSNLIAALVDASYGQGIILPGGEINDGDNVGLSGFGWYVGKDGVTLQFRNIDKRGAAITLLENSPNKTIEIGFEPSAVDHQTLAGAGANDHAAIDAHIAALDNPHQTNSIDLKSKGVVISLTPYDLDLANGPYFVSTYTGGPTSVINLPPAASELPDGLIHPYYIYNKGTSIIEIHIDSYGELFADGISKYMLLPNQAITLELNTIPGDTVWSRREQHNQYILIGRITIWDASNFGPPSQGEFVPFEINLFGENDDIYYIDYIGAPTDIVLKRAGRYRVSYSINVQCQNSGGYGVIAQITLNGDTDDGIPGTQNLNLVPTSPNVMQITGATIPFDVAADDVIQLAIAQAGITTGYIAWAVVSLESEV